jgi:formylglycine-generating enzyme required for sulfatase activity
VDAGVAADGTSTTAAAASQVVIDPTTGRRHRTNIWQGGFPYGPNSTDGHVWAAPVDSFGPQNGYGLYHMIGNVRWVPAGSVRGRDGGRGRCLID